MVRLRQIGAEFRSPDEVITGAQMTMQYLKDMQAYQDYLDGDLSKLYDRMLGNDRTQDITGSAYYKDTGNLGYFPLNYFQSVNRTMLAAVFESNPRVLDGSDEIQKVWLEESQYMLKAARQGVSWRAPKGRSVWVLEKRYGDKLVLIAWDPQYYIPITDYVDRDLVLGHILWRPWWSGPRVLQHDFPDRVTFYIYIDEEGAALSEGRLKPTNEVRNFQWSGTLDAGVVASSNPITLGKEISRLDGVRIQKVWTNGDDDSLFKTMERTAYESILALSHARTALTQDVRAILLLPRVTDPRYLEANGNVKLDRLRPQIGIAADELTSGAALGYAEPHGPAMADAFLKMHDVCLDNLAYAANLPRESFGLGIRTNESGEALAKLQQTFKTMVIDIRTDLSKVLSEAFEVKTGHKVTIGWEHEPYVQTRETDIRTVELYRNGLVDQPTAQVMLDVPVKEVEAPQGLAGGNQPGTQFGPSPNENRSRRL